MLDNKEECVQNGLAIGWIDAIGSLYLAEGVRTLLQRGGASLSIAEVESSPELLRLVTGAEQVVYPSFQFLDNKLIPGFSELLKQLPGSQLTRWNLAAWLISANDSLGELTPLQALTAGELTTVLALAKSCPTPLTR